MQDAMRLRDDRILRTLPLHTKEWDTLEDGMFPGNHESTLWTGVKNFTADFNL